MKRVFMLLGIVGFCLSGCSCSDGGFAYAPSSGVALGPGGGGGLGATPGGTQDIGLAREKIKAGQVPSPDILSAEGLLSEHDIPTSGTCSQLLCVQPSLGIAPSLASGTQSHWLVLGMSSGLSAKSFRRPPLDAVVLIDRSSSMSGDMKETNNAVVNLLKHLRKDDRVGVLKYNSRVDVVHPLGGIKDLGALSQQIRSIRAAGSHDIYKGFEEAFKMAQGVARDPKRLRRIFVFSCGYPVDTQKFRALIAKHAHDGIGVTFIGVLLSFNHDMAKSLSEEKGGSYHFTMGLQQINDFFSKEFDTMVTPLAYDLKMRLELHKDFEIKQVFGIPGDDKGAPKASLEVKTVFLSRRKGAVVVQLQRKGSAKGGDVGKVSLSYTPEPAMGWSKPYQASAAVHSQAVAKGGSYFASPGVRKAVALVNMVQQMKGALKLWFGGDKAKAREQIRLLREYLEKEAAALKDDGLKKEVELLKKLRSNM